MSVLKKVAATAAAIVLGMGVLTPIAAAQEAPVETVSPAPAAADDTTTTLPPGTVTQAPAASASPSESQTKEPSAAPKSEHAASAVLNTGDYAGQAEQFSTEAGANAVFFLEDDGAQHQRP